MKPIDHAQPLDLRSTLALVAVGALGLANGVPQPVSTGRALLGALVALGAVLAACAYRTERRYRVSAALGVVAILLAAVLLTPVTPRLELLPHPLSGGRSWLLAGALVVAGGVVWGKVRPRSAGVALLAAVALLLSGKAVLWNQVLYGEVSAGLFIIRLASRAGFVLIAAALCLDLGAPGGQGRAFWPRLGLLFLTGALLRVGAVVASPDPVIDVYSWLHHAPRHVLQGHNPYAVEYPNPYTTERGVKYGFAARPAAVPQQSALATYPPLPIVLALPCAAAGLDVRYANVACDLLAAAVLFLAGWYRGAPLIGALASGTFLHLPRAPFMIENTWFEPMLAATSGGGLLLVERGNRLGHLLLGLGLTGKQFGVALLPALWKAHRKQGWWLLLGCGLAGGLVILPFFLWGPRAFLDGVVFRHLGGPPDLSSLTLRSAAHLLFGLGPPGRVMAGVAALAVGWVSWRVPEKGSGAALWLGAALLAFCLCFVKGYYNYFYLCEYLLLLGAAALTAGAGQAAAPPAGARAGPPPEVAGRAA
jgi:hypothetical protein